MDDSTILKYFILPLYGLSVTMFKDKYITLYLNKEGTYIFLHLSEEYNFSSVSLYRGTITIDNKLLYIFETSDTFKSDVDNIILGKYSKISQRAIDRIIQLSALKYMQKTDAKNVAVTSKPLLALIRHPVYKEYLENKIGLSLTDNEEWVSKLKNSSFIESLNI